MALSADASYAHAANVGAASPPTDGVASHAEKKARLVADLRAAAARGDSRFGLAKRTSNLFRERAAAARPRIDLSHFDQVIRIDRPSGAVEAEGMITYEALADATLREGAVPAVVPELKSITLGGAVAGVGIEASSFRYGLVHDAIRALEVLTADGNVVTCTPDNEHRDLFFGFPNSYGTLGYAIAATAQVVPARPFVRLDHVRHTNADACFEAIGRLCAERSVDFLEGVVFGLDDLVVTTGRMTDEAPRTSDYTYERIYYRSLRERQSDWLTLRDFLWRWDTDWFWCSKNVGAQNPLLRRLYGRERLNSIAYQRLMRWNSRWGFTRALDKLRGIAAESVIQDVDIPLERATEYLAFMHREIGILPIWLCPIRAPDATRRFPLYPLRPQRVYVNFGFWDVVRRRAPRPPGELNRKIERKVAELSGIKSLYSESYYPEDEFWSNYDRRAYAALKARYDPGGVFPDLYEKCVRVAARKSAMTASSST